MRINTKNTYSKTLLPSILENNINHSNKSSLIIYPNPTQGLFTAKLSDSDVPIAQYKIYSLLGKLIQSREVDVNEVQIDLNSLNIANGLYILEAIDENNKIYRKELSYEK